MERKPSFSSGNRFERIPPITAGFLVLIAVMFLADLATGGLLAEWGMRDNLLLARGGQLWRFVTPALFHGGWSHVLMNAFAIFVWGSLIERIYGRGRYLAIILFSAVMGVALGFAFSAYRSLGASTVVFGYLGALLSTWTFDKRVRGNTGFFIQVAMIIGFNLLMGFMNQGVDNYGHLGGLLGGYLMARAVGMPHQKTITFERVVCAVGGLAVCGLLIYLGMTKWG